MIPGDRIAVARTPLRLSLGGGGTDLPFYSERFGGDLTTAAISLWVTVIARVGRIDGRFRYSYEDTAIASTPGGLGNPYVEEALDLAGIREPCELVSMGPVPAGTGLGSSGAFAVSLLAALHALAGHTPSSLKLAEQAYTLEANRLGHPTGRQDHYACALGGLRRLIIDETGRTQTTEMDVPGRQKQRLERCLHLFYTGLRRESAGLLAAPLAGAALQQRIEGLHQIRALGDRTRVALEAGRIADLPALMSEHWQIKSRGADPRWDSYLTLARRAGAEAGKIVGAGGGGFLLVFAEPGRLAAIVKALACAGLRHVPFGFVTEGVTVSLLPARGPADDRSIKEDH